jgi:hypothetical protein
VPGQVISFEWRNMHTEEAKKQTNGLPAVLPDGNGGFVPCPAVMTEGELIRFLRIPETSKAKDHHNVIVNLKRMHGLPRIHLCGKALYPLEAVKAWVEKNVTYGH